MSLDASQLAVRRTGITGTDMPAILGLSSFRTALDVWLDKCGKVPPVETTDDMERGTYLEDGARRWYAHRTGALRVDVPGTVVSRRNPLIIATPDGVAHFRDGERALEIKMPSTAHGWGEPGTDAIPEWYLPQVAWQLAALDMQQADVFAVLDGKPRLYHVTRDAELEGLLVEHAERFWRDHVQTGRPPEVTARDAAAVTRWRRRHEGEELLDFGTLKPEVQAALEEYLRAYAEESAAAERLALWEARAKVALGTAPGVKDLPEELGFHRLDWRAQKGKPAWKAVAETLAKQHGVSPERLSRLVAENTGEGARPFTPRPITKGKR
jgi:putative phage-type endonuclease